MAQELSFRPTGSLLYFFLLFILISCTEDGTDPGSQAEFLEKAEERMKSYVDEGILPGVATLVVREGEIVQEIIYGMADMEEGRKITEQSIYRIYSMSKPITAAALMILYDEGKFRLDDPVENHLPIFSGMKVWEDGKEVEQGEPFTIRQLLTHTAGFCYGWGDSYVDSLCSSLQIKGLWNGSTLEEMAALMSEIPLKHQPGTTYEYSISIDVAGYLVEVLSGTTFDVFLKERLFDPLGMIDTDFMVKETDYDRQAMIYAGTKGNLVPIPAMVDEVRMEPILLSGGGGLVSTVSDYARFGLMLLNGGELDGVRILEESTVNLIISDHLPEAVEYEEGYGLGGQVDLQSGAYGWGGAASTNFAMFPDEDMLILSFSQYFPVMRSFSEEYIKLIQNAFPRPSH